MAYYINYLNPRCGKCKKRIKRIAKENESLSERWICPKHGWVKEIWVGNN